MNIDHYENIERQRQQLQERAHDLAFELYSVHYLHSDPSGDWLRPWVIEYFPGGSRYEFETYEQALKWIEEEIPKRHSDFEEADEVEGQGKDDEARPLTCEEKKQEIDRLYDLAEGLRGWLREVDSLAQAVGCAP